MLASAVAEMSADPIENLLYLPNKEAVANNPEEQRREECERIELEGGVGERIGFLAAQRSEWSAF